LFCTLRFRRVSGPRILRIRLTQDLLVGCWRQPNSMREASFQHLIARGLARALLADAGKPGGTALGALQARAAAALGQRPFWLRQVLEPLAVLSPITWQKFDVSLLARRLEASPAFALAFGEDDNEDADGSIEPPAPQPNNDRDDPEPERPPRIRRLILRAPMMRPRPLGLEACTLPDITTDPDLARWLQLSREQLRWLAPATRPLVEHYRYSLQAKQAGGLRLLETPKVELKRVQRHILHMLLGQVPVHEAAHGFTAGRSVKTHAAAHAGQAVVIRFDLRDFFGSVGAAQVNAVWRTLGYPEGIARSLTTLCTHHTAGMVIERLRDDGGLDWMGAKRLASAHLPQGAPTSPALANLCAFNLDLRLEGLAWVFGATYTRYADDLVFSGAAPLRRQFRALHAWVAEIARDEGFSLHPDKTRCLPRHQRQRVTGVVVNVRPNVSRDDFDRLKACLHQSMLHGPASQNTQRLADFRSHLLGRIGWVGQFSMARQARLMRLFEKIDWSN
jgi:RNA-directed DNA polymerase